MTCSHPLLLLPLVILIQGVFLHVNSQSETARTDVDAILEIKTFYKLQRDWNGDPCVPQNSTWEGLSCSYDNSSISPRIVSLNLSSTGLHGEISTSFSKLDLLRHLDLSSNNLTGEIPDFLAHLSQLNFLDLSNNNLTGSVPEALLNRSEAKFLNLKYPKPQFLFFLSFHCSKSEDRQQTMFFLFSTGGNPLLSNQNPDGKGNTKTSKTIIAVVATVVSGFLLLFLVSTVVWRLTRKEETHLRFVLSSFDLERKQFSYRELVEMTNNFAREIGKGGFGSVYHGVYGDGVEVAVKLLSHSSSQGTQEFQIEAQLLSRIHHKNLVLLIGYCDDINHLALVYEYIPGGSLEDLLSGKIGSMENFSWRDRLRIASEAAQGKIGSMENFSWRDRLRIASEAAQGLEYLHKGCRPAIIHRDVKPSNILLTKNMEVKLSDFGLSKIFQNEAVTHVSTRVVGTPGYLDPEYSSTNQLAERSDVYSFGVVLLQIITGLPAILRAKDHIHIARWVQKRTAEIPEIVDKRLNGDYNVNSITKAIQTAMSCVDSDPQNRPTMTGVLALLNESLELEDGGGEKILRSGEVNVDDDHRSLGTSERISDFGSVGWDSMSYWNNSSTTNQLAR